MTNYKTLTQTERRDLDYKMDDTKDAIRVSTVTIRSEEKEIAYMVEDMQKAIAKGKIQSVRGMAKRIETKFNRIDFHKNQIEELTEQFEIMQRQFDGFGPIQEYLEEILEKDVAWHKEISAKIEGLKPADAFKVCGENKGIMILANLSEKEALKAFKMDLDARYKKLKAQCEKTVGVVESFDLQRNANYSLDGYVIGDKGRASISTHGAGGYNIQRFHYRTKVKAVSK